MLYIQSFRKIGSGIHKLIGGIQRNKERQAHRQHGVLVRLIYLFKISRPKRQKKKKIPDPTLYLMGVYTLELTVMNIGW
jgi:hypothetical protein